MHKEAYQQMDNILKIWDGPAKVLDVGSYDVNGTYKPLILKRGWEYTGIDQEKGPNVDIVSDPYKFPFEDESFDIVISGSTMEHVVRIWDWVPELARVVKKGGLVVIITHTSWPYHPYPVDCWRIMPDGMNYLVKEVAGLNNVVTMMYNATDISCSAWKT